MTRDELVSRCAELAAEYARKRAEGAPLSDLVGLRDEFRAARAALRDLGEPVEDVEVPESAAAVAASARRPRVAPRTSGPGGGVELDMEGLAGLFSDASRGPAGRAVLAALPAFDESAPEPLSTGNGAPRNDALIREAVEAWRARRRGDVRTAAICDPLDVIREIPECFRSDEPVSSVLPQRPASRLGFQFTPSLALADVFAGSTVWGEADQAGVDPTDPDTWKPCVNVACPPVETVRAQAATACFTFDSTTEMSSPERVENAIAALNAAKARRKESAILQAIDAASGAYSVVAPVYGALPDLVRAVNTFVGVATAEGRLAEPEYVVVLPPWLPHALTIDRTGRAFGSDCTTDDVLECLRSSLHGVVDVVVALDPSASGTEPGWPPATLNPPGAPAVALPSLPNVHRVRVFAPADVIYGTSGEVNVGVERSPDLLRRNQAQWFAEEFFVFARHGCSPWASIDLALCENGSRAGLQTPFTC